MRITILTVGRQQDAHSRAALAFYMERLAHHANVNWIYITPSRQPDRVKQLNAEALSIGKAIPKSSMVILLDEHGTTFSSPKLAALLQQKQNESKDITFIIGGAYGVNSDIRALAELVWSLSELVFPHQLVRIILTEQLYRAYSIMAGLPYHHD